VSAAKTSRSRIPSGALVASATTGGVAGALVEVLATAAGFPLPPGSGALITAGVTALAHWVQGHGRRKAGARA
jgi:hypothetical protein